MKKIRYLDGLRGLAAFQVVFHHFILAFYPALFLGAADNPNHLAVGWEAFGSSSFLNLFWDGNVAVCLFFVLSGFVLSHKFFLRKEHEIVTASALKRYFRLALPVAFSVFCAFVLMKFSLFYNQPAGAITGANWLSSFWQFQPNFLDAMRQSFVGTFFTNVFNYNALLWTISYEFIGSFLVFSFLALFGRARNRFWVYAFLVVFFFQTYYLAFVLGMILSDLMAHRKMIFRKYDRKKILRVALLILGLILASFPSGRSPEGTLYAYINFSGLGYLATATLYHILGSFLIMAVLLNSARMQKYFSWRVFLFLGEISFSMYLLHLIILGSFSSFVFLKLQSHMNYSLSVLFSFGLSLPVIFFVSYLASKFVDKKAVNFSHLVYEKVFSRIDVE